MLTKDCKILLDYLINNGESPHLFGWSTISKHLPKSFDSNKLICVLEHLQKEGYLSYEKNVVNEVTYIELFHKAFTYKEISLIKMKEFLMKSILVPIIVSIITTLIGLFIKSLFV